MKKVNTQQVKSSNEDPEGAGAVGARVVPALLVHRLDVPRQVALGLVGDAGAVGARNVLNDYKNRHDGKGNNGLARRRPGSDEA
jgi:hypothetical protein